jgi:arsenate reductase (thioredoxin)
MIKILFVCVHNAARSQMAEAFLNRNGEGKFIAESAGLEAGVLNPLVVEAMAEVGYDLSRNQTKSVFDFYRAGKIYHHVIKVCDEMNGQKCPIFPGTRSVLAWNFEDPATFVGTHDEKLAQVRELRDRIHAKIQRLVDEQALMNLKVSPIKRSGVVELDPTHDRVFRIASLIGLQHADPQSTALTTGLSISPFALMDSGVKTAAELLMANLGEAWLMPLQQAHVYTHQLKAFVDEVENQMVPGSKGIRSIEAFVEGFHRAAAVLGLNVRAQIRSIVGPLDVRPPVSPLITYLQKSFERNQPVAWLRLSQSSPWSLVIGARVQAYSESVQLEVVENGSLTWVDMTAWLNHDQAGGGLVSLILE